MREVGEGEGEVRLEPPYRSGSVAITAPFIRVFGAKNYKKAGIV